MSKIKILFLVSNPLTQDRLALDEECREITAKIRSAEHRDAIELIAAWAVRPPDLQELLLQHRPHVVHFSGHGAQSGSASVSPTGGLTSPRDMIVRDRNPVEQLVLMDEAGGPLPMSKAALVHLFNVLKDNVHLVLLSACHTAPIAEALAEVVPCTIGMREAITDSAAITFAAAFYQGLGFGRNIQEAFDLGKNALMNLDIPEDHTPLLCSRRGNADHTKAVLVGDRTVAPPRLPAESISGCSERLSAQRGDDNLLHMMWNCLDGNLQDAFSLAYNKKRRQGGNRISTKDFFQALVRLGDDSVNALIRSLPADSLPDPIDAKVPTDKQPYP